MRRRLTFANVTALLALFFALSAGSYAAIKLPANSVTGKQVKDHSLLKKDFKAGQLPRGAQGAAGAAGAAGAPGPTGPQGSPGLSNLNNYESAHISIPSGGNSPTDGSWRADCPAGQKVIGTGYNGSVGQTGFVKSYGSFVGGFVYNDTGITITDVHLQAICAQVAGATATATAVSRPAGKYQKYRAELHARTAKTCGAGYTHAVINGAHKCLRRGQYCAQGSDRQYHRYGFHCHKRDARGSYHLT